MRLKCPSTMVKISRLYRWQRNFYLDFIQLARFIAYTLITAPPNYVWQQFLEKALPAYPSMPRQHNHGDKDIELRAMEESIGEGAEPQNDAPVQSKFSIRNTLAKWFIDCITAGAIMNTVAFLVVMGILKGQPTIQIVSNIKTVSAQQLVCLTLTQLTSSPPRKPYPSSSQGTRFGQLLQLLALASSPCTDASFF